MNNTELLAAELAEAAASQDLLRRFETWPPRSLMHHVSRAVLYALVKILRPKVIAEVGTLFAGTTELFASALLENGQGVVHTTDPFGADRCPAIIGTWPQELRSITQFHALNSMDFFLWLAQRAITLDLVLVDGNHDFEFALFDLQMAARLLRRGGVIVMDNAEQTGPFYAARAFVARNPAWRELGNSLASYNKAAPFDETRSSIPGTSFLLLRAPSHLSIGEGPHSSGQKFVDISRVSGFTLDLPNQVAAGVLFYQAILRAFGNGNQDLEEWKSIGSVRLDLDGPAMMVQRLPVPLQSDMATRDADARFTFEIDLSWHADAGSVPLALSDIPTATN
jgi:predicted O-methyltransferase YrrM